MVNIYVDGWGGGLSSRILKDNEVYERSYTIQNRNRTIDNIISSIRPYDDITVDIQKRRGWRTWGSKYGDDPIIRWSTIGVLLDHSILLRPPHLVSTNGQVSSWCTLFGLENLTRPCYGSYRRRWFYNCGYCRWGIKGRSRYIYNSKMNL